MKWLSLVLMITQMVGMVFILRISRTEHVDGPRYLNTTAIFLSEVVKFCASLVLHWWNTKDFGQCRQELWAHSGGHPSELLKTCVPSLLYTLQNNLLFVGLSHLSAGTYQVTYQLKILTTAALSVVILGTRLNAVKWFSLVLLTFGVSLVNMSQLSSSDSKDSGSTLIGLSAVIAACFTSGFAGVYIEKILKQTVVSIWIRNAQLAFSGSAFALVIALQADWTLIMQDGFLQGYNPLVWVVVVCQAVGGLLVAAVMKYADNILKCFGCAIAIVFTCTLSVVELHEFTPDFRFLMGAMCVVVATGIYSLGLPRQLEAAVLYVTAPCLQRLPRFPHRTKVSDTLTPV